MDRRGCFVVCLWTLGIMVSWSHVQGHNLMDCSEVMSQYCRREENSWVCDPDHVLSVLEGLDERDVRVSGLVIKRCSDRVCVSFRRCALGV